MSCDTEERKLERQEEEFKNTEIKRHHRKTSPEYLFQPETHSSKVHLFWIPKKKLKTQQLQFTIPAAMGFYHVNSSFYLGGGRDYVKNYLSSFRTILPNGEATELQKMPTSKSHFAMTLWEKSSTLFALGGFNGSRLSKVEEYSLSKNIWKAHSELRETKSSSSAVVLHYVLYKIGGWPSSHSVEWCGLG